MSFEYKRKINYYETDRMGVVHHSNYIRFLEEARCYWLEWMGMPFDKLEENGITIPVLEVNCSYKYHVTYGDTVIIIPKLNKFNGVRMTVEYNVIDEKTKKIVLTATTNHCFTNIELKPINLKKYNSEFYNKFNLLLNE